MQQQPGPYAPNRYGYAPQPAPMPPSKGPSKLAIGAGSVILGGLMVTAAVLHSREVEEFSPIVSVCGGGAPRGTRALAAGQPHRLVGARMTGSAWVPDFFRVPGEMRATEAGGADVVACFGDETNTTLETCTYQVWFRGRTSEANYPRTQAQLPVRLVAASTGQVISQGVIQGAVPPACDSQRSTAGSSPSAFHVQGAAVSATDVQSWVQSPAAQLP